MLIKNKTRYAVNLWETKLSVLMLESYLFLYIVNL